MSSKERLTYDIGVETGRKNEIIKTEKKDERQMEKKEDTRTKSEKLYNNVEK